MTKFVLKSEGDRALVFWPDQSHMFVVVYTANKRYKPGDIINDWYWGKYFSDLQEALDCFNKEKEKIVMNAYPELPVLSKEYINPIINLTQAYYRAPIVRHDILAQRNEVGEIASNKYNCYVVEIVESLAKLTYFQNQTIEQIYAALVVLGYTVTD